MCFLNGQLVVRDTTLENYWEPDKPIYPTGQIELQNHGGPLWFKNYSSGKFRPRRAVRQRLTRARPGWRPGRGLCGRGRDIAIPAARRSFQESRHPAVGPSFLRDKRRAAD